MNIPLVTVFIPVYNSENYIADTLKSIIEQSYTMLEILIIDDGSTDDTVQVIKTFTDKRIRLLKNNKNMGIPYTRNRGLKEAKGKYLAIMDSDDISEKNRISKQVEFLEANSQIDVLGSYYSIVGGLVNRKVKSKYKMPDEIAIALLFSNPIANPTVTLRMETLSQHNIQYNDDHFVAQDYGMWVQISKIGKIQILPEFLVKYRTGHLNITKKSIQKKANKRKEVIDGIHTDLLNYYELDINQEEQRIYNQFFSDFPFEKIQRDTLYKIPLLLTKIENFFTSKNIFNKDLFRKVLRDSVVYSISNQNLSLLEKLKLYLRIEQIKYNKRIFKDFIYIFTKHVLRHN